MSSVVAHSLGDVDRVLQWGFGWELGPFQTIDAIGVREVVEAWRDDLVDRVEETKGRNCKGREMSGKSRQREATLSNHNPYCKIPNNQIV